MDTSARARTPTDAILPLHIDSTMLSCFRSCPQKFYREFICGLRPSATSIDLHFGAVFSHTLEHFYRMVWEQGVPPRTALDRCLVFFEHEWGDAAPTKESSPKTKENCWDALESYVRTYPPHTDHVQPLMVGDRASFEFSFAVPLSAPEFPRHPISSDPFIYVGRADLLGEYKGLPIIRDEKTSSRLDSNWSDHWNLRSQFLGYCWAAQQGGIPVEHVCVRGIVVKKKSPCVQVEAIKTYSRMLIARWYEQLRRDLWRLVRMWEDFVIGEHGHLAMDSNAFDFNLGETCTQYGLCPYMDLCQSPNPERWSSNYVVKRWNPLDRNPLMATSSSAPEGASATSLAPA